MDAHIIDQLQRLYNTLCQINVKGQDVKYMNSCLIVLEQILSGELEQKKED